MTLLEVERSKSTFDVEEMTNILDGGKKYTMKRRWIYEAHEGVENFVHAEKPREEQISHSISHFMKVHAAHFERGYIPKDMDMQFMSDARMTSSPLTINFGVFSSTLRNQASDEQNSWWLEKARLGKIVGCYAQTELAHGSNVRGLLTTATYDPLTEEWIVNSPSVGSIKWWSTSMPCSTHAAVYAQAYVNGKHIGLQVFMVQLRGPDLKPLPGIEVGDIGMMLGENDSTIGYCRFDNVRIPRRHLLEKRQHVTPDGKFMKEPHPGSMNKKPSAKSVPMDPKMAQAMKYVTMMKTRIALASTAAGALAKACTITARYSCVRQQGFVSRDTETVENQVMDYSVQRFRILKWISTAYAFKAATQWMIQRKNQVQGGGEIDLSDLPEIHATGAGLKALTCVLAADGIEDLRRACGGHGFLMSSGIAPLEADFKGPNTTAEGAADVLFLQTARFLMKSLISARKGEPLSGLTECLQPLGDERFNPNVHGREKLLPGNSNITIDNYLDYNFLVKLFELRTLISVARAGDMLNNAQKSMPYDQAWNFCARQLSSATRSHVRYFIISKFAAVVSQVQDSKCQFVLGQLCALYGLNDILDGDQWHGIILDIEPVEAAITQLCTELRPNVIALTDAFEFPDRVLNSALGRFDGLVYEALYKEAQNSAINTNSEDGVPQFMKALAPYLDLDFLKSANKQLPNVDRNSKL